MFKLAGKSGEQHLPLKGSLKIVYLSTIILAILLLGVSVIGIIFHTRVYPDEELSANFMANDILNLCMGLPMIGISMILTRRQKLVGLLCYPGALFYLTYVYATYLLGVPFGVLSIPYLLLVGLSLYTLIGLISKTDFERVQELIGGRVPLRTSGIILLVIALLVVIFQCHSIIRTLILHVGPDQMMIAQWIVDLVIAMPPAIIVSISMIRKKAPGHALGMGLLFLLSALFVGLIPLIVIKGILTGTPVSVPDILLISVSSLICVIPFVLFVRGVKRKH